MKGDQALTVAELIKELQKCPQAYQVFYVGAVVEHTELSAVGIDRIKEPRKDFGQVPRRDLLPSWPEIDVVILK